MTDWQKRCEYLKTKIKALEFYKDDIENATRMALDERCSLDQKHCTCVPLLRFEIDRLQAANADLKTTYKKLWESHRETAQDLFLARERIELAILRAEKAEAERDDLKAKLEAAEARLNKIKCVFDYPTDPFYGIGANKRLQYIEQVFKD